MRLNYFYKLCIILLSLVILPDTVYAQGFGMGSPGMKGQGAKDEKDMVIESAKSDSKKSSEVADPDNYLDKPPSYQLFSLDGYMRLRNYWFYRLDLGHHSIGTDSIASPFSNPIVTYGTSCSQPNPPSRCKTHTITSTNMRLRLNPILKPSDNISIFSTIDIFDNLVLGSTPSGFSYNSGYASWMPYPGFSGTQAPLEVGSNSAWDSIRIKSLYGHVDLKLFDLSFGRMPSHFGMGISRNSGSELDSDIGDYIDRVQISSKIPAYDLKITASWDFASQGLTSQAINPGYDQGQPMDLDDFDDSTQWTLTVIRSLSKKRQKKRLLEGKSNLSFGGIVSITKQKYSLKVPQIGDAEILLAEGNDPQVVADLIVPRNSFFATPDFWLKYEKGDFKFEMELAAMYGWITSINDVSIMADNAGNDLNYLSYGGVMRMFYKYNSEFNFSFELGHASGDDQYESYTKGLMHYTALPAFPRNGRDKSSLFLFHPSYHVDLIFFRQIMGTVHNSTYGKFNVFYKSNQWRANGAVILPIANEPVATPGNDYLYGVESNFNFSYTSKNGKFIAGVSYGFFYPLAAMDRPASIYGTNASDSSVAHTFLGRIILKF
jgi:uncharacterized protein (TIGR04551 family)